TTTAAPGRASQGAPTRRQGRSVDREARSVYAGCRVMDPEGGWRHDGGRVAVLRGPAEDAGAPGAQRQREEAAPLRLRLLPPCLAPADRRTESGGGRGGRALRRRAGDGGREGGCFPRGG